MSTGCCPVASDVSRRNILKKSMDLNEYMLD